MKILQTSTLIGLLASVASGYAVEYKDADYFGGGTGTTSPGVLVAPGDSYSDTFSISAGDGTTYFMENTAFYSAGREFFSTEPTFFTPGAEQVTSGSASFWFRSISGDSFTIEVELGSFFTQSTSEADSGLVAKSLNATLRAALNVDGTITYTIRNTSASDIILDYAYLKVVASPLVGVPDGGSTALLLGLGFFGLATSRRLKK